MIPYDVTITKHFRPSEAAFVTIENKTESEWSLLISGDIKSGESSVNQSQNSICINRGLHKFHSWVRDEIKRTAFIGM
jgi:hypothetical protein